jgi:hypothetical protein
MPGLQLNVVWGSTRINYETARLAIRGLDSEGSLADKALNYREHERMLTSIDERRNDVLIPEELNVGE